MTNPLNDGLNKPDQIAGGLAIQAGSAAATNVAVNVTFGTTFANVPKVQLTLATSGAAATQPGMVTGVNAGSFQFLGTSGLVHNWAAFDL